MTKENFFHKKSVVATFAILAVVGGIFFMQQGSQSTTGNIVLSDYQEFPYNFISIIGMALILCAIVLVVYVIKKR